MTKSRKTKINVVSSNSNAMPSAVKNVKKESHREKSEDPSFGTSLPPDERASMLSRFRRELSNQAKPGRTAPWRWEVLSGQGEDTETLSEKPVGQLAISVSRFNDSFVSKAEVSWWRLGRDSSSNCTVTEPLPWTATGPLPFTSFPS